MRRRHALSVVPRRRFLSLMFGMASAASLAGCGLPQLASQHREEDSELKRFAQRGYDPATSAIATQHRDTWLHGDEEITIELLLPQGDVPSPLIVYLPGMGEVAEAGVTWRKAWAQAGYAVASVQTGRGKTLWSSSASRSGDFAGLAREQFGVASLAGRLKHLDFVLRNLIRRAAAADGIYARIDATRMAIAGFEMGAQTALAMGGEHYPEISQMSPPAEVCALIALSPYANLARGGFAERYADINLPALLITGSEDRDPYGLVDSPSTRQAPFKFMPSGDKYLLVVEDGTHRLLAGSNQPPDAEEAMPSRPPDGESGFPGREPPGGGRGPMGGRPGAGDRSGPPRQTGRRPIGGGGQHQSVVVERVSIAFLDAVMKNDPVAREWLTRDARRWIDPAARLETK
jgi:predicted dienelactone hydrolase